MLSNIILINSIHIKNNLFGKIIEIWRTLLYYAYERMSDQTMDKDMQHQEDLRVWDRRKYMQ